MQLKFNKLYTSEYLNDIDASFCKLLLDKNPEVFSVFKEKRHSGQCLNSNEIIEVSKVLDDFLAGLFDVQSQTSLAHKKHKLLESFYKVKRNFVEREASKKYKNPEQSWGNFYKNEFERLSDNFDSWFCQKVLDVLDILKLSTPNQLSSKHYNEAVQEYEKLLMYASFASITELGRERHKSSNLFNISVKNNQTFASRLTSKNNTVFAKPSFAKHRDGFKLSDPVINEHEIKFGLEYCIYCHKQSKDYCRKGYNEQKKGCPIDQKISESNFVKCLGFIIAPAAIIMLDNPLAILTGRRICNDCELSCIYQNQTPVDVPTLETAIIKDLLNLDYGFEIYNLLTLYNPLDTVDWVINFNSTGKKIAICGLGPAGIALSHYLTKAGAYVIAVDGLKIMSIDDGYILNPIKTVTEILNQDLDQRSVAGFGGVMEYGITVRWNKNYLMLARIILQRRPNIKIYSGVRFGKVFDYSFFLKTFDVGHLAICIGSGVPKMPKIEGLSLKGVITSSNFLMSLHLAGLKKSGIVIESPVVVIGAGLTAIDVASEAIAHLRASGVQNPSVTIAYKDKLENSSAYKTNYKELEDPIINGVTFVEHFNPSKITGDQNNEVLGVVSIDGMLLSAKTVIVAIGTEQNMSPFEELKIDKQINIDGFTIKNHNNLSVFGDSNPKYNGSVVKAIASAKYGYKTILQNTTNNLGIVKTLPATDIFINTVKSIDYVLSTIFKLTIHAPVYRYLDNIFPGNIFKLQVFANLSKSIPVTLAQIKNDELTFYIEIVGEQTKHLSTIKLGEQVILMGPSGSDNNLGSMFCNTKHIAFIANKALSYTYKSIASHYGYDYFESVESLLGFGVDYNVIFIAGDGNFIKSLAAKVRQVSNAKILCAIPCQMNCMMRGVCSRCLVYLKDGSYEYGCKKQYIDFDLLLR